MVAQLLHAPVRLRNGIGAFFQLPHQAFAVRNILFIFDLMLQAGPEIHGHRLELDLGPHLFLGIHEKDGQFYKGTLRGRQVLESEQSIVIIGDIEEGATVASKGNVIVTGTIYGTVIAGASGRRDAVIAALRMQPKKLRIGEVKVKPVIGGSYSWAKLS